MFQRFLKIMAKAGRLGVVKRYGVRYGKRVKDKVDKIYAVRMSDNKCPYCRKRAVKRVSMGIWFCKACKAKFTGGAYSIGKQRTVKREEEKQEGVAETASVEE